MKTKPDDTPEAFHSTRQQLREDAEQLLETKGDCNTCERCRTIADWECHCAQWDDYEPYRGDPEDDVAAEAHHETQCSCEWDMQQYADDNKCFVEEHGDFGAFKMAAERNDIDVPAAWLSWMATIYRADLNEGWAYADHYRREAESDLFDIPID